MNMKIIIEIYTSLFTENFNQNITKFHVLLKSKQENKIYGIWKIEPMVFLLQNTYNYFLTPKTMCLRMKSFS